MFSEEVALRTIIVDVCFSRTCKARLEGVPCVCDQKVETKLFALDDDSSFIAIRDDMTKMKGKNGLSESDVLWTFDEDTGVLRQRGVVEALVTIWDLEQEPKRFLCEKDKPTYMKVVNYAKRYLIDG